MMEKQRAVHDIEAFPAEGQAERVSSDLRLCGGAKVMQLVVKRDDVGLWKFGPDRLTGVPGSGADFQNGERALRGYRPKRFA
jgi:hypothetical protein